MDGWETGNYDLIFSYYLNKVIFYFFNEFGTFNLKISCTGIFPRKKSADVAG